MERKHVMKKFGVWFVVLGVLLFVTPPGYALDQKKINKLITSVEKKHAATVTARDELVSALRKYERLKSGTIDLVQRWVNLVESSDDPKKKRKFWDSAFKQCKQGYKDIRKLHGTWEKKSKALWKELKNLNQALEE